MDMAVPFFRRLGDIAQNFGVVICLEPNPTCYGANFMTTSAETAQVVEQIAHPAVRMQLDTGALTINGEDPATVLQDCALSLGTFTPVSRTCFLWATGELTTTR